MIRFRCNVRRCLPVVHGIFTLRPSIAVIRASGSIPGFAAEQGAALALAATAWMLAMLTIEPPLSPKRRQACLVKKAAPSKVTRSTLSQSPPDHSASALNVVSCLERRQLGIADDHVDPAEPVGDGLGRRLEPVSRSDIAAHASRLATAGRDELSCRRRAIIRLQVSDGQPWHLPSGSACRTPRRSCPRHPSRSRPCLRNAQPSFIHSPRTPGALDGFSTSAARAPSAVPHDRCRHRQA